MDPPRHLGPVTERCVVEAESAGKRRRSSRRDYAGARRAWTELDAPALFDLVEASGLEARGRWGRRVAEEWGRPTEAASGRRPLICHSGTRGIDVAADRMLIEHAPHLVIEGLLVAARATNAAAVQICTALDHEDGARALDSAIADATKRGHVGDDVFGSGVPVAVSRSEPSADVPCGGGALVRRTRPRRDARPQSAGAARASTGPTARSEALPAWFVDAETAAQLALIATHGAEWFRERGVDGGPGTVVFEVSGAIERPGLYELPLGTRLGELLFEHAGGVSGGRKVGAVLPGGLSSAALTPGQLDVPLLDSALREQGSALGRGQVVVFDDGTCMAAAAEAIAARFRDVACGRAVHCREGTAWVHELLGRILAGSAARTDLDLLLALCDELGTDAFCGYADAVGVPVRSMVDLFRDDFEAHLRSGGCRRNDEVRLA